MTEQEWLACTEPQPMLEFLRGKASDRKLRLFAVACCWRIWNSLKHELFRDAVRKAEQFADGLIPVKAILRAREEALTVFVTLHSPEDLAPAAAISAVGIPEPKKSAFEQVLDSLGDNDWWQDEFDKGDPHAPAVVTARNAACVVAAAAGETWLETSSVRTAEAQQQASILRDLFGNPFRPVAFDPAWRTPNVFAVAQSIYAERRFADLPILADALEEAGCASAEVLAHCRAGGEHVKGCWAVDLVLGKS
jgi:hypothetical protein